MYLADVLSDILVKFCDSLQIQKFLTLIEKNKSNSKTMSEFANQLLKSFYSELKKKTKEAEKIGKYIYPYTIV